MNLQLKSTLIFLIFIQELQSARSLLPKNIFLFRIFPKMSATSNTTKIQKCVQVGYSGNFSGGGVPKRRHVAGVTSLNSNLDDK